MRDRRNGSYSRHLLTELGDIELSVPRTRRFCPSEVLRSYARRAPEIDRAILAGFVLGLSTRKVGEVLLARLGRKVSASTVSRVAKTLDEAVAAFHARPLADRYKALMLDGVVLARRTGAGALKRPVLVALGIRADGKKEIIDFHLATPPMESFGCGRDFAAWVGLTPRQHSTAGKQRRGRITKMGQRDLRQLLVLGATSVLRHMRKREDLGDPWLRRMIAEKAAEAGRRRTGEQDGAHHLGADGQEGNLPGASSGCRWCGIATRKRKAVWNWNAGLCGHGLEGVMRG